MRLLVDEASMPLTGRSRLGTIALIGALAAVLLAGAFTPVKLTSATSSADPASTSSTLYARTTESTATTTSSSSSMSSTSTFQTSSRSQSSSSSSSTLSSGLSSTTFTTISASTNTPIPKGTVQVVIPIDVGTNESLNFQPSVIKVVVGVNNTIIWNDLDATQHTVKAISVPPGGERFDSGILNEGQTFTVTLTVPGTYKYDCSIHPDWMVGTIRVLP